MIVKAFRLQMNDARPLDPVFWTVGIRFWITDRCSQPLLLTLDRSTDILPFLSDVYRKTYEETKG